MCYSARRDVRSIPGKIGSLTLKPVCFDRVAGTVHILSL